MKNYKTPFVFFGKAKTFENLEFLYLSTLKLFNWRLSWKREGEGGEKLDLHRPPLEWIDLGKMTIKLTVEAWT